jgi:hypothetical protein
MFQDSEEKWYEARERIDFSSAPSLEGLAGLLALAARTSYSRSKQQRSVSIER